MFAFRTVVQTANLVTLCSNEHWVLLEMDIVAAEGLGYHVAGSDHGPIHVDRQPRQVEPLQLVVDELAIQGDQRLERFLGELLESVDHRAVGGDARQATEPGDSGYRPTWR